MSNYFTYVLGAEWGEGDTIVKHYPVGKENEMMRCVCQMIAFADYTDETIAEIVLGGRKVQYCGWMQGMHMMFRYSDSGEIAYENWFPQWDH